MIGYFLILICLTIVFLTTPNARRKIRNLYRKFLRKYKLKLASYKRRYPRLFGPNNQLNRVEGIKTTHDSNVIGQDLITTNDSLEELGIINTPVPNDSEIFTNISSSLYKTFPEIEKDLEVVNLIENTDSGVIQFLDQKSPELTSTDVAHLDLPELTRDQSKEDALKLLIAGLCAHLSRQSTSLNEEPVTIIQDVIKIEEANHSIYHQEPICTYIGDVNIVSNDSTHHDDQSDLLEQQINGILPPPVFPMKPEDSNGISNIPEGNKETINHYEENMEAHDILLKDKHQVFEKHDGVIDIDEDEEVISIENLSLEISINIPSWPHRYIYSVSDLDHASQEQKDFYEKFKRSFYQDRYIDTLGNSNYYFILLFDIFDDYKKHKDLKVLEKLVDNISLEYPRTRSYARKFLLEKMYEANNSEGIERLESVMTTQNSFMSWDWQSRFRDKLNLSKADQEIIGRIYLPTNSFVENSFCATELIKLYIRTVKVLNKAYVTKGLQKNDEFGIVLDLIARKEYRYHFNSTNYNYHVKNASNTIYGYILKYCEQLLRSYYFFKKLSSFDRLYAHAAVNDAIKEHILVHIEISLSELQAEIAPLDSSTEKFLYTLHPTRWKSKLRLDEAFYIEKGNEEFIGYAETIIALNNNNSSLENIFLELSKFLAGFDKQKSLEYFLRYTDQNMSARKLVPKEMSKTVSRKLFKDSESNFRYNSILTRLMSRELTIEDALLEINGFYEPIRKKIHLDQNVIQKVQQDFTGTVGLLGEILSDENLEEIEIINLLPTQDAEPLLEKVERNNKYLIDFTQIESSLLDLFNINAFSLSKSQIAEYCHLAGSTQNVLINNINEKCYDALDDLLIEDNTDVLTIDVNYYAQITQL